MADHADRSGTETAAGDVAGIIVAAGSGSRAGMGTPKQYASYGRTTVLGHAVERFRSAITGPILVVIPGGDEGQARSAIGDCDGVSFVTGGATRQESVRAGLERLASAPCPPGIVLIHDAPRPDLPREVAERLIAALRDIPGAIPVLPVVDSMVEASGNIMAAPARRENLRRVQTPQAFRFADILAAHRDWQGDPIAGDDAQVLRKAGLEIALVDGDARLAKLTFREDFAMNGAASHIFLSHAASLAAREGYAIANCDLTIICEAPKVGPHREAMRARLAELLAVDMSVISVKATTTERLGFTGRGEGIAAQAQILLTRTA